MASISYCNCVRALETSADYRVPQTTPFILDLEYKPRREIIFTTITHMVNVHDAKSRFCKTFASEA